MVRRRGGQVMVVMAVWLASGAAQAQSAATCSFDPDTAAVAVAIDGGEAVLEVVNPSGEILLDGSPCGGATVESTDSIQVTGGTIRDRVVLVGRFVPGLTAEADGSSEIEIGFSLGGADDTIRVVGNNGANRIRFTAGGIDVGNDGDQDTTTAGTEILVVEGRGGDDVIDASDYTGTPAQGRMRLFGGDGNDRLLGDRTNNRLEGGPGDDVLYGNEDTDNLYGGPGNDSMYGGPGLDQFFAEPTPDGADLIRGGPGDDWVNYAARTGGVTVTIGAGSADDGAPGEGDSVEMDVENVVGGAGDDVLVGSGKANTLTGQAGDDEVYGGGGNDSLLGTDGADLMVGDEGEDSLSGGDGADVLIGGAGSDTLNGGAGNDTIYNADGEPDHVDCGPALMDDAEPDPADTFEHCEL